MAKDAKVGMVIDERTGNMIPIRLGSATGIGGLRVWFYADFDKQTFDGGPWAGGEVTSESYAGCVERLRAALGQALLGPWQDAIRVSFYGRDDAPLLLREALRRVRVAQRGDGVLVMGSLPREDGRPNPFPKPLPAGVTLPGSWKDDGYEIILLPYTGATWTALTFMAETTETLAAIQERGLRALIAGDVSGDYNVLDAVHEALAAAIRRAGVGVESRTAVTP